MGGGGGDGTEYPFFNVPFSPFVRRPKTSPTVPCVKKQRTALTARKMRSFATPHSPPQRLVRMLVYVTQPHYLGAQSQGGEALDGA